MKYLVKLRKDIGLTQWQVAKKLGYESPQFVSNWERGVAELPACQFRKISKLYKIPVEVLIDAHLTAYEARIRKAARN